MPGISISGGIPFGGAFNWTGYWATRYPSGLVITVDSTTQITLNWTNNGVADYDGVRIERSDDGVTYTVINTEVAGTATYINIGLTEGTHYYYRTYYYRGVRASANSNTDDDYTMPLVPTVLNATTVSTTRIDLTWTNNSVNDTGISIERSTDGVTYAEIGMVPPALAIYSDVTCTEGTRYYYRVRCYAATTYSAYSNADSDYTLPLAPTVLTATTVSDTRIDLAWTNNSANDTGISIERSTDGITYAEINTVLPALAVYSDITCVPYTLYYYRIRCYVIATYSAYSNVDSERTAFPAILSDGNTVAWFLYDEAATITKTANLVARWNDYLASGHDLIQATDAKKPLWSSTGILFDGLQTAGGDHLKCDAFILNQPIYVYALIKQVTWINGSLIWDGQNNNTLDLLQNPVTPQLTMYMGTLFQIALNNVLNTYQIHRCFYNGINSSSQIDATTKITGDVGAGAAGGFTLGALGSGADAGHSNTEAKEIIIRKTTDTAPNEILIYNYLVQRKLFFLVDYDKVLVMGNSLAIYPISAHWWGSWGMAATIRANDYVHKLQTKIRLVNSDCVITPLSISAWETNHTTYDKSNYDSYFTDIPDLVVIQAGDNVADETDFDVSYQALIDYIKTKAPLAKIAVTGVFFTDATKDATIKAVAATNGIPYTELSSLRIAANTPDIGDTVYDEEGNPHLIDDALVAEHPNDIGMNLIAEKIYQIII